MNFIIYVGVQELTYVFVNSEVCIDSFLFALAENC